MKGLLLVLSLFIAQTVYAEHTIAVGGGLLINHIDTDGGSGEADEELSASLNVGAKSVYDLNENLQFRTGLYLQERSAKYSVDVLGVDGDITANVISGSLPLNLQYKLNEKFAIFGGYTLDYNINDYCDADGDFDSCTIDDDEMKSTVHYVNFGASIWANDKIDIDVSYQRAITETYDDIKIHSIVAQIFVKI